MFLQQAKHVWQDIVHEVMFAFLKQKTCWRKLIFSVISGHVNYLGTWIMFAGIYFLWFKDGCKFLQKYNPSRTSINLQYPEIHIRVRILKLKSQNYKMCKSTFSGVVTRTLSCGSLLSVHPSSRSLTRARQAGLPYFFLSCKKKKRIY